MNVLFLHHFEEMWEDGLKEFGTTLEKQTEKVLDFLEDNDIHKIIVTRFEDRDFGDEHAPILSYCNNNHIRTEIHQYGYPLGGMSEDEINEIYPKENKNKMWCQGTRAYHDESYILDIEPFHHEFKKYENVYLAGAFESECILDQEAIFDAIGVEYEKIDGLVVGDGLEYDFKNETFTQKIQTVIDKYTDKINSIDGIDFEDKLYKEPDNMEDIIESFRDDINELEISQNCYLPHDAYIRDDVLQKIFDGLEFDDEYEYDLVMEKIENAKIIFENTDLIEGKDYFHGTYWKNPTKSDDFSHEEINSIYNDDDVIYLSDGEDVSEFFAKRILKSQDYNLEIPILMKVNLEIEKAYIHDSNERDVTAFDEDLSLDDRKHLFSQFEANGYNAFIIPNNYDNGSDMAYLNDIDYIDEAKAYLNDEWTDYMSVDDLKEVVLNHSLENKNKVKIKRNRSTSTRP